MREQVEQVIGTTPVHASRVWCALVAEGLIRCHGHIVTVADEPRLIALSQYCERDAAFDHAWLRRVELAAAQMPEGLALQGEAATQRKGRRLAAPPSRVSDPEGSRLT